PRSDDDELRDSAAVHPQASRGSRPGGSSRQDAGRLSTAERRRAGRRCPGFAKLLNTEDHNREADIRMNGNDETDENRAGSFPATRWSLVLAAAEYSMSASRSDALSTLYSLYWYPLYVFARRQGNDAEQARDATQGFFVRIMEKGYLREFRGERGRFRTFL